MSVIKRIISLFLIIACVGAMAGAGFYTLSAVELLFPEPDMLYMFTSIAVYGAAAILVLSIISIIMNCAMKVKRGSGALGLFAVICGVCGALLLPRTSADAASTFGMLSLEPLLHETYTDYVINFLGLVVILFSLIIMIMAIVDMVKTGRGE